MNYNVNRILHQQIRKRIFPAIFCQPSKTEELHGTKTVHLSDLSNILMTKYESYE